LTTHALWHYYAHFTMNASHPRFFFSPRTWIFLFLLLFAVFALTVYAFLHAGLWLVREDPAQNAQAVAVLSGGLPDRALWAAAVYRAGLAKEVWITRPMEPRAAMRRLDLPYSGEEDYSRMVLIAKGVPPEKIRILAPEINNTAEELNAVFAELQSQPGAKVVIVTSKVHTRRVRAIWNVVSRGTMPSRLLVRAASDDRFDAEHWWRTTNDALSVVREYLGLLNAWAGFPLRHSE
jgi:uncharacterized SAM-binding protein YcdF (DUF218 family)